ncbi:MAG: hypothetical protein ACRD26_03155 [Vicinamibacterales bacterium]
MTRRLAVVAWCLLAFKTAAGAQEHSAHQTPATPAWQWSWDGTVFAGFNYQYRRFTDFYAWESQNWLMLHGERRSGRDTWRLHAMTSLEAFTLQDIGSPQVFQTGETFQGVPLVDYQHPHDLVMGLGATWQRGLGAMALVIGADLVGQATLGPDVFMHRESARDNPQAPLGHHHIDATHITHGVVRAGVTTKGVTVEASAFQGREPDETRTDLDLGPLDSYAGRMRYERGGWRAQISAGHLNEPEPYELLDVVRLTASVGYEGTWRNRPIAWIAAWGQNQEGGSKLDAYLLEGTWRMRAADSVYVRGELVTKVVIGRSTLHPPGFRHQHQFSRVGALTGGYVRDLVSNRFGRFGLGGDMTGYRVPPNLQLSYGSPVSFHAFLRWRAPARHGASHH